MSQESDTAVGAPDRFSGHGDDENQLSSFLRVPGLGDTIDKTLTRTVIQSVCGQHLDGKKWEDLDPKITCASISRHIERLVVDGHECIRERCMYKLVVQTVLFKYDLQLFDIKARCFWDEKTDRLVHDIYVNDSVICKSQVYFASF